MNSLVWVELTTKNPIDMVLIAHYLRRDLFIGSGALSQIVQKLLMIYLSILP